jgi:hypothetical protein
LKVSVSIGDGDGDGAFLSGSLGGKNWGKSFAIDARPRGSFNSLRAGRDERFRIFCRLRQYQIFIIICYKAAFCNRIDRILGWLGCCNTDIVNQFDQRLQTYFGIRIKIAL